MYGLLNLVSLLPFPLGGNPVCPHSRILRWVCNIPCQSACTETSAPTRACYCNLPSFSEDYERLANRSTKHPTDRYKAHREVTLSILIYCWQLSILMIIFRNCKYKIPLEAKRLTDKTYRWTKQSAKGLFLSSIYIYG